MISKYEFHPFEFCVCGYSNSGKTVLISKLIKELSKDHSVGYVKHDAHRFQMDKEGKDTFLAMENGASGIFINDKNHFSTIQNGAIDGFTAKTLSIDFDLLLIEGYKDSDIPKILFIDSQKSIMEKIDQDCFSNIFAFVGKDEECPGLPGHIPYFQRDNIKSIIESIKKHLSKLINSIPVYGLLLRDSNEDTQLGKKINLLQGICEKTFTSSGPGISEQPKDSLCPMINNTFLELGQSGTILSALYKKQDVSWLVLSSSLAEGHSEMLDSLIKNRNPLKIATAFVNTDTHLPEPFLAIYEPRSRFRFMQSMGTNCFSPADILNQSNVNTISYTAK